MTQDRAREGDWDRTEWEGEGQDRRPEDAAVDRTAGTAGTDATDTTSATRWNKDQWPGDQGHGEHPIEDPDTMPEGETGLSGDRHAPSEQHWARGQEADDKH